LGNGSRLHPLALSSVKGRKRKGDQPGKIKQEKWILGEEIFPSITKVGKAPIRSLFA